MITKINRLANFGTYRQFQWGSISAFTKYNLLYGWNYSGKTTLSRLFQILEDPTELTRWPGCQFDVELQGGARVTQANLAHPHRVKVFNRDFIQSNFQQEHKAPAVFVVGGNTIHLRNRINRLNVHGTKVAAIKTRLDHSHTQLRKELDSLGTTHASSIATITGDKTYNRTKLAAEIDRIKATPATYLLAAASVDAKVLLLRSPQQWEDISTILLPLVSVGALHTSLCAVLQKTAANEAISKLKENRELEAWVRTGLTYHHHTEHCEFCGSTIPTERLGALQRHFSKAYEELISEVSAQVTALQAAEFDFELPDERDFVPDLKTQFLATKAKIGDWSTWADTIITKFISLAKQKQISVETIIECDVDVSRAAELTKLIDEINALIATHNQKRGQLDAEKAAAKDAIEKHHAANYYLANDIAVKESALQVAKEKVDRAQDILDDIFSNRSAIEAKIQQQSIAAQKIDETVQFLLPDNYISVAEVPGGYFEFRRDGVQASNLSESEKTAITFAYFLATIENHGASLNQTIVFIDDPISSLDSNHIYAIYALITKRLDSCLQLFVATHNSELYGLLKGSWFDTRQQFANTSKACSYYTRRYIDAATTRWNTTIDDTPILLRKYKSEYQFIFDQLHQFSTSQTPSLHEAYTAPNLLRKFLEAYLGFKKPCVSKWSDKLDLLIDAEVERVEIQKFADDASHLQGLNRALQQPDFISNSQATVKKVIQSLKAKDLPHYTSMCTVIGVAP
jgi:wobble nucleotide-excising tRNase